MDRVKIPSGSIQKLETVFDDLQSLIHGNLKKKIDAITGNYGVVNSVVNSEQNTDDYWLKLSVNDEKYLEVLIQPGVGLLEDGELILVENAFTGRLDEFYTGTIHANGVYQIHLKHTQVGTDPIVAMNAFFFDKVGVTPYSQRFTRWSDSYELVGYLRTENVALEVPEDEIPLGMVKVNSAGTRFVSDDFTFSDVNGVLTSVDTVIDIRKNYTYRLDHNLLDDSTILFKDRSSTGVNKIQGNLEAIGLLGNTLTISGISTLNTTNVNGTLSVSNTAGTAHVDITASQLSSAALIFKDNIGSLYRGYTLFDLYHNFLIGFDNPIPNPDEPDYTPENPYFVITNTGYIGNIKTPLSALHLQNKFLSQEHTEIFIENLESDSVKTSFKFGVGILEDSVVGYIKPVNANTSFFFSNITNDYVLYLLNTIRKTVIYDLEVETRLIVYGVSYLETLSVNTANIATANIASANISYLTLSGLTVDSVNLSSINLAGTSSTEFRVGVGSDEYPLGRAVMLEEPNVNIPSNFRIFDVSPSEDRRESMSYVWLKWNWDGLNGTKQGTDQVVLNAMTTNGENLNLTAGAAILRKFYFSSSGNMYGILSYDSTTRTITLDSNHTGADIISDTFPAKIIDENVTSYTIRAIELTQDNNLSSRTLVSVADADGIAITPGHALKLGLDKKWSLSIKASNRTYSSTYVTMLPGTYDPDHVSNNQVLTAYSSPLYNTLPYIDGAASPGALTLTATAYGFRLDIEGWESTNRETSPHEFEIAYTTLSGITWDNSNFSTTKKGGATFVRTTNRTLQISTNDGGVWTVGVRPIQNNQPVGVPVLGIVTSGGGGIVPNDSVVIGPLAFNIIVASGIVSSVSGLSTDQYGIEGYNNELWGETTLTGRTITINGEETNVTSNTLRFN